MVRPSQQSPMIEPSLIEAAHVAVIVADDDRRYVHANAAACDLLRDRELIGMRVEESTGTPPDQAEQAWPLPPGRRAVGTFPSRAPSGATCPTSRSRTSPPAGTSRSSSRSAATGTGSRSSQRERQVVALVAGGATGRRGRPGALGHRRDRRDPHPQRDAPAGRAQPLASGDAGDPAPRDRAGRHRRLATRAGQCPRRERLRPHLRPRARHGSGPRPRDRHGRLPGPGRARARRRLHDPAGRRRERAGRGARRERDRGRPGRPRRWPPCSTRRRSGSARSARRARQQRGALGQRRLRRDGRRVARRPLRGQRARAGAALVRAGAAPSARRAAAGSSASRAASRSGRCSASCPTRPRRRRWRCSCASSRPR